MNSQNSFQPPSSDGPQVVRPPRRGKIKKRGGQPGHPHHSRTLLPPEKVTGRVELAPNACPCGCTHLNPTDDKPLRHQGVDIPPIKLEVTEYIQHIYRCRKCGQLIYQPLPGEQQQPQAHADESGWPRGNRLKGWLWTLCCSRMAVFLVQAGRGQPAARKLLGSFTGTLHSDRWSGYNPFAGPRQLCWAHLKRDFQALSEAKGKMGRIGQKLSDLTRNILASRNRVRDGTLLWKTFQSRMKPLMEQVETLLQQGADGGESCSGQCRRIYNQRDYLWTFIYNERVEPTNNLAERVIRQAVLWRKGSFGAQSERGACYVERILSVCATCRLQGRSIIAYLQDVCQCHLKGIPAPSLVDSADNSAYIA